MNCLEVGSPSLSRQVTFHGLPFYIPPTPYIVNLWLRLFAATLVTPQQTLFSVKLSVILNSKYIIAQTKSNVNTFLQKFLTPAARTFVLLRVVLLKNIIIFLTYSYIEKYYNIFIICIKKNKGHLPLFLVVISPYVSQLLSCDSKCRTQVLDGIGVYALVLFILRVVCVPSTVHWLSVICDLSHVNYLLCVNYYLYLTYIL